MFLCGSIYICSFNCCHRTWFWIYNWDCGTMTWSDYACVWGSCSPPFILGEYSPKYRLRSSCPKRSLFSTNGASFYWPRKLRFFPGKFGKWHSFQFSFWKDDVCDGPLKVILIELYNTWCCFMRKPYKVKTTSISFLFFFHSCFFFPLILSASIEKLNQISNIVWKSKSELMKKYEIYK